MQPRMILDTFNPEFPRRTVYSVWLSAFRSHVRNSRQPRTILHLGSHRVSAEPECLKSSRTVLGYIRCLGRLGTATKADDDDTKTSCQEKPTPDPARWEPKSWRRCAEDVRQEKNDPLHTPQDRDSARSQISQFVFTRRANRVDAMHVYIANTRLGEYRTRYASPASRRRLFPSERFKGL